MKKFICSICGYEYDEAKGDPNTNIPAGTKFEAIPEEWLCPLCGAPKLAFEEKVEEGRVVAKTNAPLISYSERGLSLYEMSALCSNLAKGCDKQFKLEQAELLNDLAVYFKNADNLSVDKSLDELREPIQYDLDSYQSASSTAKENSDRGALRALVWSEKVTKILSSILLRYGKQKEALLEGKNVFVCEICGFVYIGNDLPDVCPVCKVPNFKMKKIARS